MMGWNNKYKPELFPQIHPSVVVDPTAIIEEGVIIEENAVIREHVYIERFARVGSGANVNSYCMIAENAEVKPGEIVPSCTLTALPPEVTMFDSEDEE